jgi:hypothetical protein
MARKLRIAALCASIPVVALLALLAGAYVAARQVRPFYQQALQVEPAMLVQGGRELESRATALYSDARQNGEWKALFTEEQINGWLATQLANYHSDSLPANVRDPRVAIEPDVLKIGFCTTFSGVKTVVSVDASVFLTNDSEVAIRLIAVQAGALSLPVMQAADDLADACQRLRLPVRWTQEAGEPIAVIDLNCVAKSDKCELNIDSIELGDNELYIAGHTTMRDDVVELDDYELRFGTRDSESAVEIARRPKVNAVEPSPATGR